MNHAQEQPHRLAIVHALPAVAIKLKQGPFTAGRIDVGTDAGQGMHYTPPYPAHYTLHGAGKYGLQCLCNLDQLPPTGAFLLAAPLKIKNGTGSPLRVLAMVEGGA